MKNLVLSDELKKEMNYTEEKVSCNSCTHHEEKEGMLDRSWDSYCNYNNIGSIRVMPYGRCKHYQKEKS